ncbi:MAG: hypothetical protein V1784_11345 [bacterium]
MRFTGHAATPILLACLLFPAIPSNAFDFLRISPSPAANGRGGIFLPGDWDDPQYAHYNPAGLGFAVMQQRFGAGFSDMKWLPGWHFVDMSYRSFGLYAPLGKDDALKDLGYKGAIHYGVGLNGVLFDLGETERRDEFNRPIGTFHSWENSYAVTLAAATASQINTAFGVTLKGADAHLSPSPYGGSAAAFMFDFGGLLELPLVKILQGRGTDPPDEFGLNPEVTCGLGYALTNVGGKVYYEYPGTGSPLPRTASISTGIAFELRKEDPTLGTWRILTLGWGVQGDDDLVCATDGSWRYSRSLRGDIRFFNDLVFGRFSPNIIKLRGWELGLIEALYVRVGAHEDPEGNVFYHTYGFGLRFAGLYKCLVASGGYRPPDDLFRHLDIRYDFSRYDVIPYRLGDPNPLDETKGHFVSLYFR